MKRLLLVPLVFLLTSCSYGSRYEALQACYKWREKFRNSVPYCHYEDHTNQILGRTTGPHPQKVLKRFKY